MNKYTINNPLLRRARQIVPFFERRDGSDSKRTKEVGLCDSVRPDFQKCNTLKDFGRTNPDEIGRSKAGKAETPLA